MNAENNTALNSQLNVFDLQSLRRFTTSAESKDASLEEAAKQFEGIFIRQLLTSMRKVNDLFKQDSLFDSSSSDFYQEMWDDQIATSLGDSNNSTSISSLMIKQFDGSGSKLDNRQNISSKYIDLNISNPSVIKASVKASSFNTEPTEVNPSPIVTNSEPVLFKSKQQFIDVLYPKAKLAAEKIGGSAKALLAQIALETGWGKHIIQKDQEVSSNNLFNIKQKSDWNGDVAFKKTVEFDGEQFNVEQAGFKVYQNFTESFADFIDFITSKERYQTVIENAANPKQYFNQLQQSGYATDPEYATKIDKIYNSEIIQNLAQ